MAITKYESERFDNLMVCIGLLIVVAALTLAVLQPYFEARAFNKFSKIKASYWDAVWSTLRVNAQ